MRRGHPSACGPTALLEGSFVERQGQVKAGGLPEERALGRSLDTTSSLPGEEKSRWLVSQELAGSPWAPDWRGHRTVFTPLDAQGAQE